MCRSAGRRLHAPGHCRRLQMQHQVAISRYSILYCTFYIHPYCGAVMSIGVIFFLYGMYRVCRKNDPTCFCWNFVKFPPNLIIFDTQIAKKMKLCEVHSLSTSPNLCQCTTI